MGGSESWEFDTFTPGPVGAECRVEHGRGKWISYSPPGTLACNAEECDPGYMTTDMVCVPISAGAGSQSSLAGAPLRAASLAENTTTELSYAVGYQQHQHLNCYTGHGAAAIGPDDGLQQGVHSVDECARAADENGGYANSCFVYFWKYNQCFLRKDCNLDACEQGTQGSESWEFDTFTPGPVGTKCLVEHGQGKWVPYSPAGSLACNAEKCDPGYMTTDMVCVPINYYENEHTNCYSGHGGTALGPNDGLQAARDVEGCKAACNNADECRCFVFFSKYSQCFLRSECQLQQCEIGVSGEESYLFDTYIASSR